MKGKRIGTKRRNKVEERVQRHSQLEIRSHGGDSRHCGGCASRATVGSLCNEGNKKASSSEPQGSSYRTCLKQGQATVA